MEFIVEGVEDMPDKNPDVYARRILARDGFDVVGKAPGSFFFFGNHAAVFWQPALVQPIPLYFYVGIKKRTGKRIVRLMHQIRGGPSGKCVVERIAIRDDILKKAAESMTVVGKALSIDLSRYEIGMVSQVPMRSGLSGSGSYAAALTVAASRIAHDDKLTTEHFTRPPGFSSGCAETLGKAFISAHNVESEVFHANLGSGAGAFAGLVGSSQGLPFLYARTKEGAPFAIATFISELPNTKMETLQDFIWQQNGFVLLDSEEQRDAADAIKKPSDADVFEIQGREISSFARDWLSALGKTVQDTKDTLKLESPLSRLFTEEAKDVVLRLKKNICKNLGAVTMFGTMALLKGEKSDFSQMVELHQRLLEFAGYSTERIDEGVSGLQAEGFPSKITGAGGGGHIVAFGNDLSIEKKAKELEFPVTMFSSRCMPRTIEPAHVLATEQQHS
jgi:mevalonate kinase